jgi:hypothetical protein
LPACPNMPLVCGWRTTSGAYLIFHMNNHTVLAQQPENLG